MDFGFAKFGIIYRLEKTSRRIRMIFFTGDNVLLDNTIEGGVVASMTSLMSREPVRENAILRSSTFSAGRQTCTVRGIGAMGYHVNLEVV